MKRVIYFAMATAFLFCSCTKDADKEAKKEGSIFGLVSDELNHELQRAKITLTDQFGKMETKETGTDGLYEFQHLVLGKRYTVEAELRGYYSDKLITIVDKTGVRGDFVLKEIALRLSKTDIDAGFTNNSVDFIIYNDSQRDMAWTINYNTGWLTLSKTSGTIPAKGAEPIQAIIDRTELPSGSHEARLIVNSSHEYKELLIKAQSEVPKLAMSMPTVTNRTNGDARLQAQITLPTGIYLNYLYEAGFVISTNPKPTLQYASKYIGIEMANHAGKQYNMTVNLNGFFKSNQTYYIRAYANTMNYGVGYSNEIIFTFP